MGAFWQPVRRSELACGNRSWRAVRRPLIALGAALVVALTPLLDPHVVAARCAGRVDVAVLEVRPGEIAQVRLRLMNHSRDFYTFDGRRGATIRGQLQYFDRGTWRDWAVGAVCTTGEGSDWLRPGEAATVWVRLPPQLARRYVRFAAEMTGTSECGGRRIRVVTRKFVVPESESTRDTAPN